MSVDLSKPVRFKGSKRQFYPCLTIPVELLDPCNQGVYGYVRLNDEGAFLSEHATLGVLENFRVMPEPVLCYATLDVNGDVYLSSHCIGTNPNTAYFRVSRTEDGRTVAEVVKEGT